MRGGALDYAPAPLRSSLGIGADGTLTVARVGFDGTWRGTDQRRQLDLNKAPLAGHTTLYTSAWGPTTPAESGVVADVIGALPPRRRRTASSPASSTQVGAPTGGIADPARRRGARRARQPGAAPQRRGARRDRRSRSGSR